MFAQLSEMLHQTMHSEYIENVITHRPLSVWKEHIREQIGKEIKPAGFYDIESPEPSIQLLYKLLKKGMDAQEAMNELVQAIPKYHKIFLQNQHMFSQIFEVLLTYGATCKYETINILLAPIDETLKSGNNERYEFKWKVLDFPVRAWIILWFEHHKIIDMNKIYYDWDQITPNNWDHNYFYWKENYRQACLEYMKYLLETKCEV